MYRFSSKEYHPQSRMYYYGYRWYSPQLQRWLNRDPIFERGGMNLYRFVRNDAIRGYDLFGLLQRDQWGHPEMRIGNVVEFTSNGHRWPVYPVQMYTDDGQPILGFMAWESKKPGGDFQYEYNCHGHTFGNDEAWINDEQVDTILAGDNYVAINPDFAQPGDIVVYVDNNGNSVHSGVITLSSTPGNILVESKDAIGRMYYNEPIGPGPGTAWNSTSPSTPMIYRPGLQ